MKIYSKQKFISKAKITIPSPFICRICNKELKSIPGLASHLKNQHNGMPYGEYLFNFYNIDVFKINEEWENKRYERKISQLSGLRKHCEYIRGKSIHEILTPIQYDNFKKNMKGVFSIKWFIEKFGEKEGIEKYKERSIKLSKITYWKEYNSKNSKNWSPISQELFFEIYKRINSLYKEIYFGELNHEFSCGVSFCNFDFVVKDIKKIIEFNGDKWHANPKKYNCNDIPFKFINKKAEDIWSEDKLKIEAAQKNGYNIKIVWESDYRKNKEKIILECLDFLNS